MSYQKYDLEISEKYHELANKCILLKNRKKNLEEWMKNVGNIQKIEEGKTQIKEIDKELISLEPQLENALTAYMKTEEYEKINKYLQEINDYAVKQNYHDDTERASTLNKEPNIPIGGSKSRRRHRRHRKPARKTRHKRKYRSRIARKHKKYTRRR